MSELMEKYNKRLNECDKLEAESKELKQRCFESQNAAIDISKQNKELKEKLGQARGALRRVRMHDTKNLHPYVGWALKELGDE